MESVLLIDGRKKILKYVAFALVALCAVFLLLCVSGNVRADTHTWDGGGADNKITTPANWVGDSAPITNDSIIIGFDARHINWDSTTTYNYIWFNGSAGATRNMFINMSANLNSAPLTIQSAHATYTLTLQTGTSDVTSGALVLGTRGCLSQTGTGGDVSCTSLVQSGTGSVLAGKADATFYCGGDFIRTGGSMTANVLRLVTNNTSTISAGGTYFLLWTNSGMATVSTTTMSVYRLVNSGTIILSASLEYVLSDALAIQ